MADHKIDAGHYRPVLVPPGVRRIEDGGRVEECLDIRPGKDAPVLEFLLEDNSLLNLSILVYPGFSGRLSVRIFLCGSNSEAKLSGAWISRGSDRLDLDVEMHHIAGMCRSEQDFRGVLGGEAVSCFDGRIVVAPDAASTRAFQQNHNILLSESARAETRPQLEIYTDDVECSHGATVGAPDQNALFYMRSRGIPEDEARALQLRSFLYPVLSPLPQELQEDFLSEL